jgi:hypothetical protein
MADINYYSIADTSDVRLENVTIDPRTDGIEPTIIADVLKLSFAKNIVVHNVIVDAGGCQKENAVDMNRLCSNVVMTDCTLYSGKQNALTIKGGCRDITIENLKIVAGSGNCDIELGNWSDQSQEPVTNVKFINVTRTDGKPVRLRVGNAKNITIIGGNIKEDKIGSILVKLYCFFKKIFK